MYKQKNFCIKLKNYNSIKVALSYSTQVKYMLKINCYTTFKK